MLQNRWTLPSNHGTSAFYATIQRFVLLLSASLLSYSSGRRIQQLPDAPSAQRNSGKPSNQRAGPRRHLPPKKAWPRTFNSGTDAFIVSINLK